ncbi:hypothetical protein [Roseateles asaccharophilus]|uniref:Adhesin n=1 Tax=Roseateles asaccharophilus TaxID=582607 RepID=A0ABU2AC69_9BURK|nr:hypothetical protein [Roseateles asaccharophilus]MDR7334705.1 hypothetical protein [Roseateles asaccharophilus]
MTAPQENDIESLLDRLERAVFQRQTKEGVALLLQLLQAMSTTRSPYGILPPSASPEERRAAYTRIAAMISALICSPDFLIDLGQIDFLSGRKPMLEAIFELSGYEGPFHLLSYNGQRNADGGVTLRANQVFVLSLFYSLDALPPELMQGVLKLPADQLLPLMVGWFTAPFVHHARGEENRSILIEHCAKIESAKPTQGIIQAMTSAWMHCSYADHVRKHEIKRSLNEVWRGLAKLGGLKSHCSPRQLTDRPKLLICAERMSAGHAMHRSYAAGLKQLRSKFHTVCMAMTGYITADTHDLFDEVSILEAGIPLQEIGARIVRLQPDVIYYPSLGMSEWTQLVANLRFAPVQLMSLGHPAPAMCDTMDYALVSPGVGEVSWEYGRKVVEMRATPPFEPHDDVLAHQVDREKFNDGRLHLAVNSSLMKLSPRFLALCERIEAESPRPIHFHFFASAAGVMYDRIRQVFERRFRYFTLEPSRTYGGFLKVLERCDVALAAFPFGNTNSTVDTCLVHVPTVAYRGNEPLSIFDRDVLRMAGMPDWLACDTDEGYFQTVMRLINDEALRAELVEQLKMSDLREKMFEWRASEDKTSFVDAIEWIYRNHETLMASSAHVMRAGEPIPA